MLSANGREETSAPWRRSGAAGCLWAARALAGFLRAPGTRPGFTLGALARLPGVPGAPGASGRCAAMLRRGGPAPMEALPATRGGACPGHYGFIGQERKGARPAAGARRRGVERSRCGRSRRARRGRGRQSLGTERVGPGRSGAQPRRRTTAVARRFAATPYRARAAGGAGARGRKQSG